MKLNLLSVGNDAKTSKGEKYGWRTAILYLAPAWEAGRGNVCPHASDGCRMACLYSAGRGAFANVRTARIRKTRLFFDAFAVFKAQLIADIHTFILHCQREGRQPCVRLNGTSDISWERLGIMEQFPSVQFYDYTKSPIRALQAARGAMPANYDLTFSRSECNGAQALDILRAGGNVAVVFSGLLPQTWGGYPVIDGDVSDLRFADRKGVVVGLLAKGQAKKDESGFVVNQ